MITTLKEFGRGQITLPKKWRGRYNTSNYIAKETSQGLLIIPLTDQFVKVNEKILASEVKSKVVKTESSPFKKKSIRRKRK